MSAITTSKLKSFLTSMNRQELENLVLELYSFAVKDAVNLRLNPNFTDEMVNRYEKKLAKVLMLK